MGGLIRPCRSASTAIPAQPDASARSVALRSALSREVAAGDDLLQRLNEGQAPILDNTRRMGVWLSWVQRSWLASSDERNPCQEIVSANKADVEALIAYYGNLPGLTGMLSRFGAKECHAPEMEALATMTLAPYGPMFVAGKVAMVPQGSWMITYFAANAKFENAWVPLPKGPSGRRATMFNGLADSIWVGSKVKEDAWKWVKYLASADCQGVVAGYGVVFPALAGLADKAVEVQKKKGVDASAFLAMAREQTFLSPIADNGAQIDEIMKGAIESVLLGRKPAAEALRDANAKVLKLAR